MHFTDFPESELVRCNSRQALESLFLATVKEADVLKHRGDIMSNLQKRDHNHLWSGLVSHKMEQFWSVNKKLMSPAFRSIPIRIYFPHSVSYLQPLVRTEDQPDMTLADLMSQHKYFQSHLAPKSSQSEASAGEKDESSLGEKWKLVMHGQEVPDETPLQWAAQHLSYPDNFIHLCIHSRGDSISQSG